MIRIAITMLLSIIAGIAFGIYALPVGLIALGLHVWFDLRRRDLPPATRRALRRQRRALRAQLPRERWVPMARTSYEADH